MDEDVEGSKWQSCQPHYPTALRVRGSVWHWAIAPSILAGVYASVVYMVARFACLKNDNCIALPPTFLSITGLVLSMLLGFKTNSSYTRFCDGRALWVRLKSSSRSFARHIWADGGPDSNESVAEKTAAVKLVLAFFPMNSLGSHNASITVRSCLRKQNGVYYEATDVLRELSELLPPMHIERLKFGLFKKQHHECTVAMDVLLSSPVPTAGGTTTTSSYGGHTYHRPGRLQPALPRHVGDSNLPLFIIHLLSTYLSTELREERLAAPQYGSLSTILDTMTDTFTALENVATSGIPIAYEIHLRQLIWLYILLLPYQILEDFGMMMPVAVFVIAFVFLGVDYIGVAIEHPFGTDMNALPLDRYVRELRRELAHITQSAHPAQHNWSEALQCYCTSCVAARGREA
ncbi:hypothetical protein RI367_002185 [Sorochytrium milnesiophthora]